MAPIYKSNILNSEDTSSNNIVQCRTCSILAELIIKKNINDEIFGIKTDFFDDTDLPFHQNFNKT